MRVHVLCYIPDFFFDLNGSREGSLGSNKLSHICKEIVRIQRGHVSNQDVDSRKEEMKLRLVSVCVDSVHDAYHCNGG